MSGLGFNKEKETISDNAHHASKSKPQMLNRKPRHHGRRKIIHSGEKFRHWRCYHCGCFGHIKAFYFKLHGYPQITPRYIIHQVMYKVEKDWVPKVVNTMSKVKKQWVPKAATASFIAHTSLRVSAKEDWYFDNVCSRHMTGIKNLLVDIKSHSISYVTFEDGAKGEIKGVGKLDCGGVPKLNDVLLVKGLTANLINISQLYDQGFKVNFTKAECIVTNEKGEVIMKGGRSKDNCYLWMSQESSYSTTCSMTKEDEVKLWHQKLGHLHLKGLKRIISTEAFKGMPKLKIEEGRVCGECQVGKQTKMSHPIAA